LHALDLWQVERLDPFALLEALAGLDPLDRLNPGLRMRDRWNAGEGKTT
jgi:hypothetical protein